MFTNLAGYVSLYGRVPFSGGAYPQAIIVRSTSPTTTTMTTSTTSTTAVTSIHPEETVNNIPSRLIYEPISENTIDDAEDKDIDYHNDVYDEVENEIEWGETPAEGESPSLRDRTIKLTGGRDENEVSKDITECFTNKVMLTG